MPPLNPFSKTMLAVALTQAISVSTSHAATITVDGSCSLEDAIRSANSDATVGTCTVTAGSGADEIVIFPTQTITLTAKALDGEQSGASGLPLISSDITIQGNGSIIERDIASPDKFRILALADDASASLTLDSITLTGGDATYTAGLGVGGAIYVGYAGADGTSLTLNNTIITGNESESSGGGIFAASGSTVEINNSILSENVTGIYGGGGIYANSVDALKINATTISDNIAEGDGAGVSAVYGVSVTIENTTISNNSVTDSYYGGGGIYAMGPELTIVNSTISTNSAPSVGSGLSLYDSKLTIINSTISNNLLAPSVELQGSKDATFINTVIANSSGSDCYGDVFSASLASATNSWFEDATCNGVANGDPGLGSLNDHGGLTFTHAPETGSGLIGGGLISACIDAPVSMLDQRGEARGSVVCHIGAVEDAIDDPYVEPVNDPTFFVVPISNGKTVIFEL